MKARTRSDEPYRFPCPGCGVGLSVPRYTVFADLPKVCVALHEAAAPLTRECAGSAMAGRAIRTAMESR